MPEISFTTSGKTVPFPGDEDVNILRISIRHDAGLPWRCASGNCGTDRIVVTEGAENLSPARRRERERLGEELMAQGYRLACQTYTSGDCSVTWDPDQKGLDEDTAAGKKLKERWLGAADSA